MTEAEPLLKVWSLAQGRSAVEAEQWRFKTGICTFYFFLSGRFSPYTYQHSFIALRTQGDVGVQLRRLLGALFERCLHPLTIAQLIEFVDFLLEALALGLSERPAVELEVFGECGKEFGVHGARLEVHTVVH